MWVSWNWPLPGRTTRYKEKGRYSTDSGVYWPMVQNFLSVISDVQSGCEPLFTDEKPKLRIYPVTSQEDGVALKPGLQVDSHQGIIVGAKKAIDFQYISNNDPPDAEVLKNEMVKEAHCICIETLDGKFAIPVGAHYLPSAVSGFEQLEQSVASFEVLNTCLSCLKNSKMSFAGTVLKGKGHCKSECPDCEKNTENKRVCDHCQDVGHTFVDPSLRACEECITNDNECVKMVCLIWTMDSESKNKSSQITLTQKQKDEDNDVNKLVTALPDAVHVAKNDRASFANWFRLVDGYRINLVLLRTVRMDPKLKDYLIPYLSLAACRNRDRMVVDSLIEICLPEVREALGRTTYIVQTLVPEMHRIYESNKEGVLKSPVAVCASSYGSILICDKDKGKVFSARMHYPVDVNEVIRSLSFPVAIAYNNGLLLIAELGKKRIACCDLSGDHFLKPDKMTVKQLRKALIDRQCIRSSDKSKKAELQNMLKRWIKENCSSQAQRVEDNPIVSIRNRATIRLTALIFSSNSQVCVAEISGEIHLMSLANDGLNLIADITHTINVQVDSLYGLIYNSNSTEFYVASSADSGGLYIVDFKTGQLELLLPNGSDSMKRIHGICKNSKTTLVLVDRDSNKIIEYDTTTGEVAILAGSGNCVSRDGSQLTASFAQPTGVCCETNANSLFVVDSSTGRLRLITSTQALIKYLHNLWLFLSAFNLTSQNDEIDYEETQNRIQHYHAFHEECSLQVQSIKGSTNSTQGPDGTLSSTTLNSVMMILEGVARLKKTVIQINPNFMQYTRVHSLLTLFVENFFSSMRAGNTTTPTMLDFCLRFPRCVNEQLKRVTATSYNYFTNPNASYYLKPKLGNISINFRELAKLPKPAASSLAKKQKTKLRNWAMQHGKAVRQNTTRNFSTKDKPGTLPINLYEQTQPVPEPVNFSSLLEDDPPANHDNPLLRNVSIPKLTYVAISRKYIPTSIPSSSLYIAKLLDDVIDGDERNSYVRALFYKQDFLDPLSFIIASEELSVSREGIIGIVNNITAVDDDTVDINEEDYYVLLTVINGSCDTISSEECEPLQENAIHAESEEEQEPPSTERNGRPKRKRNRNANNMFFFY